MNGEREFYPQGQLTMNSAVLVQANGVAITVTNSAKVEATLANPNGTPTTGMVSAEISWDMYVDNRGPEIDAFTAVSEAQPMKLGFLFPGGVQRDFSCKMAKAAVAQSLGDVCKVNCSAVGSLVRA
jgi:hypothetical protein